MLPGALVACSCRSFSQAPADTAAPCSIALADHFVTKRELKTFVHRSRSSMPWYEFFTEHSERMFTTLDSQFTLTPVPVLHNRPFRMESIVLKLPRWDTNRLRLNLIVLKIHGGDTSYSVHHLPMKVRRSRLRYSFADPIFLQPDLFYVGYSIAAFHVPEKTIFRRFGAEYSDASAVEIRNSHLSFIPGPLYGFQIPYEIAYAEL